MIKRYFTFLFFVLLTFNLTAQSQVENILNDAKVFNKAYLDKDFKKFTEMTIPSIVDLAGGNEEMIKISKEQYEIMVAAGIKFVSISPIKPGKIMLAGDELHAILPQKVVTKLGGEEYAKVSYYLASSNDEGKTWTFVDLEPYDSESIKTFVPSFTGELEIPAIEYAEKIEK